MNKRIGDEHIKLSEEQYEYCMKNYDKDECKELIFKGHIRYTLKIAGGYFSDRYNRDELDSEALLGLWKAVLAFDPSRGFRFSTFVTPIIHSTMRKYLRKHKDHPADESLNKPASRELSDNNISDHIDLLVDGNDYIEKHENEFMIREALNLLTDQEKEVFIDYYMRDMNQPAIAEKRKCTQVNVSRLLKSARGRMVIYFARGLKITEGNLYTGEVESALEILRKDIKYFVK